MRPNNSSISHTISVILPVFMPREEGPQVNFFVHALESVIEQTYPSFFEILVIDDGSPTPVKNIVQNTQFQHLDAIRWIRNKRNEGLVDALNTGLKEARYNFIARIDADDQWLPGKIEEQMKFFQTDKDLSLVATGMKIVDETGNRLEEHLRDDGWENILKLAIEKGWCPFPHGSVVGLTSIFRLLGGYSPAPACAHAEDFHLWSNWIRFFKPAMIEKILYEYRRTPNSISQKNLSQQELSAQIARNNLSFLDWERLPEKIERLASTLGLTLVQCGVLCYRIWYYRPTILVPKSSINLLQDILPDRTFIIREMQEGESLTISNIVHDFLENDFLPTEKELCPTAVFFH